MFKKWFGGGGSKKTDKKTSPSGGLSSANEYGLGGAGSSQYEVGYGGRR